jgi:hypothetical protein
VFNIEEMVESIIRWCWEWIKSNASGGAEGFSYACWCNCPLEITTSCGLLLGEFMYLEAWSSIFLMREDKLCGELIHVIIGCLGEALFLLCYRKDNLLFLLQFIYSDSLSWIFEYSLCISKTTSAIFLKLIHTFTFQKKKGE